MVCLVMMTHKEHYSLVSGNVQLASSVSEIESRQTSIDEEVGEGVILRLHFMEIESESTDTGWSWKETISVCNRLFTNTGEINY